MPEQNRISRIFAQFLKVLKPIIFLGCVLWGISFTLYADLCEYGPAASATAETAVVPPGDFDGPAAGQRDLPDANGVSTGSCSTGRNRSDVLDSVLTAEKAESGISLGKLVGSTISKNVERLKSHTKFVIEVSVNMDLIQINQINAVVFVTFANVILVFTYMFVILLLTEIDILLLDRDVSGDHARIKWANSIYYIGFILTLTSLIKSLSDAHAVVENSKYLATIVQNAIALSSTASALLFRSVWLLVGTSDSLPGRQQKVAGAEVLGSSDHDPEHLKSLGEQYEVLTQHVIRAKNAMEIFSQKMSELSDANLLLHSQKTDEIIEELKALHGLPKKYRSELEKLFRKHMR